MNRKIWHSFKRISSVALIITMASGLFSGCAKKVELTEEEQDLVAEYAAQIILKHDKNYNGKLKEIDAEEPSKEEDSNKSSDITDGNNEETASNDNTQDGNTVNADSFSEAFGFTGLTVEYTGYQVADSYPQTSDMAFVLNPTGDMKLLILKFNVKNNTESTVDVGMMPAETVLKSVINENSRYTALVTLLMDGLNTFSGPVNAGESKELVLAFQTPFTDNSSIESLSLQVSKDGGTSIFDLK